MVPKRENKAYSLINDEIILIHQDSMESMNFNTCNSYLVKLCDFEYIIIDPGCSRKKLNLTVKENDLDYLKIKYVYLTHGHSDHVSLLDYLRKKNPKINVLIHEFEKKYVENSIEYYNMLFDVSLLEKKEEYKDFINTIKHYKNPNLNYPIKPSFKMVFDIWNVKDRQIDNTFQNGDILPGNLEVIHSPGHTPGMCTFLKRQEKILFSSDIHLSKTGAYVSGNVGNIHDLKKSINSVIDMVDNEVVKLILSGHGKNPIKEDLKKKLLNFYNSITLKEDEIIDLLTKFKSMSIFQITEETFQTYLKRFEKYINLQEFKEVIVIAKASELMANLNILYELERLEKVEKINKENKEFWTLKQY